MPDRPGDGETLTDAEKCCVLCGKGIKQALADARPDGDAELRQVTGRRRQSSAVRPTTGRHAHDGHYEERDHRTPHDVSVVVGRRMRGQLSVSPDP